MLKEHFIKNKFNFLLTVLLTLLIISPFFQAEGTMSFKPILPLIYFLSVIAILWAIISNKKEFYILAAIKSFSFILDMLAHFHLVSSFEHSIHILARVVQILIMYVLIAHLIKWLFTVEKVDGDTVKGGICVYILLGLGWMALYRLVYEINPQSFSKQFNAVWEFMYFSFMTLTTVGYGDITPVSSFAMMLASLEAMSGQLFLVIFISRLVGLHLKHSN